MTRKMKILAQYLLYFIKYDCHTSFVIISSYGEILSSPSLSNLKFYYDAEIAGAWFNRSCTV